MSKRFRGLTIERCEPRLCLTQIGFAHHPIEPHEMGASRGMTAVDLDGDGDQDLVAEFFSKGGIGWRENIGGDAIFGATHFVTSESDDSLKRQILSSDIDLDGDNDIVSVGTKLAWYENRDGRGSFGPQRLIHQEEATANVTHAALVDLDADGDLDLIRSALVYADDGTQKNLQWYENTDGAGTFQLAQSIEKFHSSFDVHDLDGDDDLDIIFSRTVPERRESEIVWFQNTDGHGMLTEGGVLVTSRSFAGPAVVADLDGNGRVDLMTRSGFGWDRFEATTPDGLTFVGRESVVDEDFTQPRQMIDMDADGDGDLDLFVSVDRGAGNEGYEILWMRNVDGRYSDATSLRGGLRQGDIGLVVADFNGDGFADILHNTGESDVAGVEGTGRDNLSLLHRFDPAQNGYGDAQVVAQDYTPAFAMATADIDADGDLDIVSNLVSFRFEDGRHTHDTVFWRENLDGKGNMGPGQRIAYERNPMWGWGLQSLADIDLMPVDLDGDGDLDIVRVIHHYDEPRSGWFENVDGRGEFGPEQEFPWSRIALVQDLDSDGDTDLIAVDSGRNILWIENIGDGVFGEPRQVATGAPRTVSAEDWDGDGDLDLVVPLHSGKYWFENLDGAGTFGPQQPIVTHRYYIGDADLDGDGDQDALLSFYPANDRLASTLAWCENLDGNGKLSPIQRIETKHHPSGIWEVSTADIDGDGDLDLFSSSIGPVWFENLDGRGGFVMRRMALTRDFYESYEPIDPFTLADLDSDGDLDAVGSVSWFENRPLGDVNGDGLFDSSDLTSVMQRGKYEDDVPENATFEDGDWDGDGDFTTSDFVLAFQIGTYSPAARAALSRIAAADHLFAQIDDKKRSTFVA